MKVIATTGRIGSGKDEVMNYLSRRYDLPNLSVGDMVREIAEQKGLSVTRENLQQVSSESIEQYGKDFFINQLIKRMRENRWDKAGVSGIRSPNEVCCLRREFGTAFVLIHVYVGQAYLRYERVRRRDREGAPQSYDSFLLQDRKDEQLFELEETLSMADLVIDNDGTREELHRQINTIYVKGGI